MASVKKPSLRRAPSIEFNHAMIYVRDVPRALAFYRDGLGFEIVEEMEGYARLRAPNGTGTIGLHRLAGEEQQMDTKAEGLRLYFEATDVDHVCVRLAKLGFRIDAPPRDMEWGWRHAYLKDPDGHEISVYHAGDLRFRPSPPRP